jgi:hypothetical protein
MEAMAQAPLWPRFTSGLSGMLTTPKDIKHQQDVLRRRLIAEQKATQARLRKERGMGIVAPQKIAQQPSPRLPLGGEKILEPPQQPQPQTPAYRGPGLSGLAGLSGKPSSRQPMEGGMSPLATVITGLGGALSSRARGGSSTLGEGFTRGISSAFNLAKQRSDKAMSQKLMRFKEAEEKRAQDELEMKQDTQKHIRGILSGDTSISRGDRLALAGKPTASGLGGAINRADRQILKGQEESEARIQKVAQMFFDDEELKMNMPDMNQRWQYALRVARGEQSPQAGGGGGQAQPKTAAEFLTGVKQKNAGVNTGGGY